MYFFYLFLANFVLYALHLCYDRGIWNTDSHESKSVTRTQSHAGTQCIQAPFAHDEPILSNRRRSQQWAQCCWDILYGNASQLFFHSTLIVILWILSPFPTARYIFQLSMSEHIWNSSTISSCILFCKVSYKN